MTGLSIENTLELWAASLRAEAASLVFAASDGAFGLDDLPRRFIFSPGTMFWGSAAYLAGFPSIVRDWRQLAAEPLADDGTVLHALERLFGAAAVARNETIVIVAPPAKAFVFSEKVMALCAAEGG
jgi:hypothetical protein